MTDRRWIVRAAAVAASSLLSSLVLAPSAASGADGAGLPYSLAPDNAPPYLDVVAAPSIAPDAAPSLNSSRAPLMALLDGLGAAQALDSARINIFGHVEASYTYNTDNPDQGLNLGRVFDLNDNRVQINQLDLNVERKADPRQFDLGGRVELLYGTDARFIHSSDFIDYNGNIEPEYQFDIPQLYFDLTIPIGNGLRLRAGKFLFFKQIDPSASVFFSHSYTFGAALPFTLTGITAYYPITDQLSIEAGLARGWDQTFTDNNGAIDGLARVRYDISKQTAFSLAAITGPELDGDNSHYRTTFDATLSCACDEHTTFLLDAVYGYQAQPAGTGADNWYGVSGYAVYELSKAIKVGGRLEVYRDEEGFTTFVPQTLYEATAGLTLTPFPGNATLDNLKIRPEIRYDYSSARFFNGLQDHDQFTLAIDAYFDF